MKFITQIDNLKVLLKHILERKGRNDIEETIGNKTLVNIWVNQNNCLIFKTEIRLADGSQTQLKYKTITQRMGMEGKKQD